MNTEKLGQAIGTAKRANLLFEQLQACLLLLDATLEEGLDEKIGVGSNPGEIFRVRLVKHRIDISSFLQELEHVNGPHSKIIHLQEILRQAIYHEKEEDKARVETVLNQLAE
jgi:hypothetical protein